MNLQVDPARLWKMLFFSLLLGYCLAYAPYGVNETDGGFITGLAWQVLQGKALYGEVMYVRPPLPVWLRAAELRFLPENWSVLGERWIFYTKIALYAGLAAATLSGPGRRRWMLAVFGFVVSVHCNTPKAWHTVDGILFGAGAFWLLLRVGGRAGACLAGLAVLAAALCKQSFYPLPVLFLGVLFLQKNKHATGWALGGMLLGIVLFISYLWKHNLLSGFFEMTGGAASGGQAIQHGGIDYLRINPWAAAASALFLPFVVGWFWKKESARLARPALGAWVLWLAALTALYLRAIFLRQAYTAPFAPARLLFEVAAVWGVWHWLSGRWSRGEVLPFFALLGVAWCGGISWGYNLPILFAPPMVFAAMEISEKLWAAAYRGRPAALPAVLALAALLAVFRYGYEFVYRDGRRSEMTVALGPIFPALNGIRSDSATAALYSDLRDLATRFGPSFKTLPSFTQASFLTKTYPPLPLDWVVRRENNDDNVLIMKQLEQNRPVFFIEKSYGRARIETDPEMTFTRKILLEGRLVAETPHFWIVRYD